MQSHRVVMIDNKNISDNQFGNGYQMPLKYLLHWLIQYSRNIV